MIEGQVNGIKFGQTTHTELNTPSKMSDTFIENPNSSSTLNVDANNKPGADQQITNLTENQRQQLKDRADKLFEELNTGLAFKFHERSGKWYAVIENKITQQVLKEIPPQSMLDLEASLKEMMGVFLDKKL
ncbi:flagellar protein FlaG [Aneurinibacillus sp. Ricciae_BoGa-3]|uniref:flagellar protein FlaG n=1 Tax=Aneurinibacillus sp. Ricciae_BoGa-3 TaxID=3022697 RepID=UPI002341E2BA|nr:flagellar protein FlaG [Aneurinibacillus sp. Ricciae_BoGa-3]WCK54186.1 flagellar protein FlaG [Aneurinibacillus sp. Ricciae_BoGa-3]